MADLRISELAALAGANLAAGDFLPIADVSASETKKITVTDLVGNATTLIADSTIPSAKILFGANTIPGTSLTNTSVTATQLANDAVTAAKLADESSVDLVTTLPGSGAFVGQLALDTDDSKIYCWDGSTWVSIKAAGSVNAVLGSTAGVINIVATTVGDQVTISATLDNTSAAAEFLAGPTAAAGAVGYRPIVGADLPTATTTTKGAVIVNGNGLTLAGDTISINNTVTAEAANYHVVQYNSKGLVTAGRVIDSSDIPVATASTNGIVKPGTGLGVTAGGTVNHTNVVAPGTGTKVSFDSEGHVTGTDALVAADIPDLSASKITSGTLDIGRIGTNTVLGSKLANFSVSKIGDTQPTAEHIGQFFFNPITRDLFLWDGNVYQPVGISAGEIVFAGTYDASTNLLTSVTAEGTAAGFTNNAALPAASSSNNRHYVVVSSTGTGIAPAPAVALQPPDLILSNGTSYVLIDVSQTVTAQTAATVVFTPTGDVSANNVQSAIAEVDSEKLAKAGDTLTGQLLVGNTGSLVFEGATDNAFETTLGVVDPTADRTINLPDVSGTVVTTGDTGSVTSTMILDGTILNADVNASAAIAGTKISPDFGSQTVATTGVFSHALGSASAPTVTFTGDTNTGIYSPGADQVAISTNGTQRVTVDTAATTSTLPVVHPLGAVGTPSITFTGDLNTGIWSPAADTIAASTGGSERLRIDSSGRVGIGTTSPGAALNIGADGDFWLASSVNTVEEKNLISWRIEDGSEGARISAFREALANAPHSLAFFTRTSGGLINERARIDSSGRLLVGTSSARGFFNGTFSTGLQVEGTGSLRSLSVTSDETDGGGGAVVVLAHQKSGSVGGNTTLANNDALGALVFQGSNGSQMLEGASVSAFADGTISGGGATDLPTRLVFSTTADGASSPTEAMRINNGQELLVGYTTDNGAYKLQVNSQIFATSATIATSDGRYKENVATLEGCVDLVKALRPVSFDWKTQQNITRIDDEGNEIVVREGHNFPDGTQVGFIAQEVQEVLADKPWLGSVIKQNVRSAVTDNDGNELAPEEEFLGIAEGNLIAVLTSALQEAISEIESLKARVAALESA